MWWENRNNFDYKETHSDLSRAIHNATPYDWPPSRQRRDQAHKIPGNTIDRATFNQLQPDGLLNFDPGKCSGDTAIGDPTQNRQDWVGVHFLCEEDRLCFEQRLKQYTRVRAHDLTGLKTTQGKFVIDVRHYRDTEGRTLSGWKSRYSGDKCTIAGGVKERKVIYRGFPRRLAPFNTSDITWPKEVYPSNREVPFNASADQQPLGDDLRAFSKAENGGLVAAA